MRPVRTYSRNTGASVSRVHSEPKHGEDSSADYSEIAEPVSMTGSGGYRERNMEICADGTIEYSRYRVAYSSNQSDENCVSRTEAYGVDDSSALKFASRL